MATVQSVYSNQHIQYIATLGEYQPDLGGQGLRKDSDWLICVLWLSVWKTSVCENLMCLSLKLKMFAELSLKLGIQSSVMKFYLANRGKKLVCLTTLIFGTNFSLRKLKLAPLNSTKIPKFPGTLYANLGGGVRFTSTLIAHQDFFDPPAACLPNKSLRITIF